MKTFPQTPAMESGQKYENATWRRLGGDEGNAHWFGLPILWFLDFISLFYLGRKMTSKNEISRSADRVRQLANDRTAFAFLSFFLALKSLSKLDAAGGRYGIKGFVRVFVPPTHRLPTWRLDPPPRPPPSAPTLSQRGKVGMKFSPGILIVGGCAGVKLAVHPFFIPTHEL